MIWKVCIIHLIIVKVYGNFICNDLTTWSSNVQVLTPTFTKILWDPFIKVLHTLHVLKVKSPK
jgi:hypothetical protein